MILDSEKSNHLGEFASALIHSRQHVSPKRLIAPGPNSAQKKQILDAAGAAPDHGRVTPWHFYEISQESRQLLGEMFANALLERDTNALQTQLEEAKEKAFRGPLLLLVTVDLCNQFDHIPEFEKMISAGCAIQNVLLMSNALGFGSGLSSGKAISSNSLKTLFHLSEHEKPVCFITIGTISRHKPNLQRPSSTAYSSIF